MTQLLPRRPARTIAYDFGCLGPLILLIILFIGAVGVALVAAVTAALGVAFVAVVSAAIGVVVLVGIALLIYLRRTQRRR